MALLNLDFSPTSPPQPQALLRPSLLIFRLIAGQEIFFPKFIFQRLFYVSPGIWKQMSIKRKSIWTVRVINEC